MKRNCKYAMHILCVLLGILTVTFQHLLRLIFLVMHAAWVSFEFLIKHVGISYSFHPSPSSFIMHSCTNSLKLVKGLIMTITTGLKCHECSRVGEQLRNPTPNGINTAPLTNDSKFRGDEED